jgi:hypothetical protein
LADARGFFFFAQARPEKNDPGCLLPSDEGDYLTQLSLKNTQVTDKGLTVLREWRQLKEVDLTGSRATNRGVADLQQALPGAKIIGANGEGLESGRD